MSPNIGWGQGGWGQGGWGGYDPSSPPVEEGATILYDPNSPTFIVYVKRRIAGAKPASSSLTIAQGPSLEFIPQFWPLWEGAGNADDVAGGNTATRSGATWVTVGTDARPALRIDFSGADANLAEDVFLAGKYSIEYLAWDNSDHQRHVVISQDPGIGQFTYIDGILTDTQSPAARFLTISKFSDLPELESFYNNPALEYVRIWNRTVSADEVTDLYADPYFMFGANDNLLDEIATIVEFMKPARYNWRFVFQ